MSHVLLYVVFVTFSILVSFCLAVEKDSDSGNKSGEDKEKNKNWNADASEGECFSEWPNRVNLDVNWFEKNMVKGFRIPFASKMYYHQLARHLDEKPFKEQSKLNKMCLKETNNPTAVFPAYTGLPLPTNWAYFYGDESMAGGIFFRMQRQVKYFYNSKFFLVHQGFFSNIIQTCKSIPKENWIKKCQLSHSIHDTDEGNQTRADSEETLWMVSKTDNKQYALIVDCFLKENKMAWHVLSINKTLNAVKKREILQHIQRLGFDPQKSISITYENEDCIEDDE